MSARAPEYGSSAVEASPWASPLVRAVRVWLVLAIVAILAVATGLSSGSADIGWRQALSLLVHPDASPASQILFELRLPRVMAAFAAGGLLGVAGASMQAILRNPLSDPYVLGLSSGAAVGALGAMLLGLGALFVDLGALAGALASLATLLLAARFQRGNSDSQPEDGSSPRLLLIGVILASGWSAIVTIILVVAPEGQLRGMLFWLMGDLGGAASWIPAIVALAVLVCIAFRAGRELNVLLLGEDVARSIGVETRKVRLRVLMIASAATAIAVTTAGSIGFVGLIVPHAVRLAVGNDQRVLLPACALAGGALLVVADTVARSAFAPQQVPVGAVMALVGVPAFMGLLLRRTSR